MTDREFFVRWKSYPPRPEFRSPTPLQGIYRTKDSLQYFVNGEARITLNLHFLADINRWPESRLPELESLGEMGWLAKTFLFPSDPAVIARKEFNRGALSYRPVY